MKAKKVILPVFLALIIALSSFVLFACGKQTSSTNTHRLFSEVMTTMKEDTNTFTSVSSSGEWNNSKFNGFATSFRLKDVTWRKEALETVKNEDGSDQTDRDGNLVQRPVVEEVNYDQYVVLVAAGLNMIDKYYPKLETLDVRADFGSVDDSVKSMKSSYERLKAEHDKYISAKNLGAKVPLVNGFFYNYRLAITDFVNKVYNCADKLMGFFNKRMDIEEKLEKDEMKNEALDLYFDLKCFDILKDFKEVYMTSCLGIRLENNIETSIDDTFSKFVKDIYAKGKKLDLSAETVKSLMKFFDSVKGSSDDARQAVKNFSVYKFVNNYDGNIDAYKKDNENAALYYDKVYSYYADTNCTINKVISYLSGVIC